jgi:RNA:NAD 2'-phosphotransferase (TPT1/KptA family)
MASIFARGIEGRSGGWAFAAPDYATAQSYGRRWGGDYVVFRVLAQQAYQAGTRFETRGGYYVARHIHPAFVDFHWALGDLAHRDGAVV